jgi:hypothetical protein
MSYLSVARFVRDLPAFRLPAGRRKCAGCDEAFKSLWVLHRHCYRWCALPTLNLIPLKWRPSQRTSVSQKSARRLASSCAAPYRCCRVTSPSNEGPAVSPTLNRVAGASSNADRFRLRSPRLLLALAIRQEQRRQPVSPGTTTVKTKMVLESTESSATKSQKSLNWDRTPRALSIRLRRRKRATSWWLSILPGNLLLLRKRAWPSDVKRTGLRLPILCACRPVVTVVLNVPAELLTVPVLHIGYPTFPHPAPPSSDCRPHPVRPPRAL